MSSSPSTPTVLLVEDDDALASLLCEYLGRHGFECVREAAGDLGERRIREDKPDLVILDLFLPGMDGLAVCRSVRSTYAGPILMLTASKSDADHVAGLELGADDFVTKPVDPRVLVARLRTLLRRRDAANAESVENQVLRCGALVVDPSTREAAFDGQGVELTTMEFDVLLLLAREAGRVVTREELYQTVCGIAYDGLDRGMDIHVSRIRRKLAALGCETRQLKAVRGAGYLLAPR